MQRYIQIAIFLKYAYAYVSQNLKLYENSCAVGECMGRYEEGKGRKLNESWGGKRRKNKAKRDGVEIWKGGGGERKVKGEERYGRGQIKRN